MWNLSDEMFIGPKTNCRKFLFGWTGSPDLVNSVAMTTLPVPSLMVINATSFHHHFPEEHYESLSRENVAEFLNRILQNEIQVRLPLSHFYVISVLHTSVANFWSTWTQF